MQCFAHNSTFIQELPSPAPPFPALSCMHASCMQVHQSAGQKVNVMSAGQGMLMQASTYAACLQIIANHPLSPAGQGLRAVASLEMPFLVQVNPMHVSRYPPFHPCPDHWTSVHPSVSFNARSSLPLHFIVIGAAENGSVALVASLPLHRVAAGAAEICSVAMAASLPSPGERRGWHADAVASAPGLVAACRRGAFWTPSSALLTGISHQKQQICAVRGSDC